MKLCKLLILIVFCLSFVACGEDDPESNEPVSENNSDNSASNNSGIDVEACQQACADVAACEGFTTACGEDVAGMFGDGCAQSCADPDLGREILALGSLSCATSAPVLVDRLGLQDSCDGVMACMPAEDDFLAEGEDTWDACVSDNGVWNRFNETISSGGRVAGYEQIADLLWRKAPTAAAFLDARVIYAVDEGLDSRVQRREDEHYPPVTDAEGTVLKCGDEGVPAMDADRCVGPAKILPVLNEAFREGALGENMEVNAARVQAALLWFFYVSTHKEAITCTVKSKDCDSAYAYYTGDIAQEGGIGLAGELLESSPVSHDRIWEGLLAVRCWRDLDSAEEATNLELRDRAVGQMDRALLHGVARVVLDRLLLMQTHEGVQREADWAFLQVLGPVLDREAGARDAGRAGVLAQAWRGSAESVDADAVSGALLDLFPCP